MKTRFSARRLAQLVGPILLLIAGGCAGDTGDQSADVKGGGGGGGGVRGAIFTTLPDGTRVNDNIYASKSDVYLDGGPGPNAPSGAAALAEGDYYFQVTDPSGKTLLSSDDITCRRIHVNASGVIDAVVGACVHVTGIDQDHAVNGAITVQLMPYDDTPNPGGEYKVWVTPVDAYGQGGKHGFRDSKSKTDNFKVRAGGGEVPDAGVPAPDANVPPPDGGVPAPDANVPPPDGGVPAPDACPADAQAPA